MECLCVTCGSVLEKVAWDKPPMARRGWLHLGSAASPGFPGLSGTLLPPSTSLANPEQEPQDVPLPPGQGVRVTAATGTGTG